uniref:Suppressor of glucose, autophagy associated 1 n=1 Tax=Pundamilia nyererei TaxID=303518 RepID=A0A3B4G000_9CICH
MLEMRDMYMEEDVYQLQELRQQLEQANKTCRILQYRLRKAERRSIRVAQTGQVDGELIRTLEQDVKVAKDVSIRLHSQLDSVEKKRSRLEQENEELRVRLQDLEIAKQVLQQEIDKNSQKKRGARPNNKPDKKLAAQEDSSDLKCQLHFAKEESALMCKKLTKLVKDSEAMKEELAKYRSLYGDINASLTVEEVADSPHTREAEIRVHLKLVEEEANLLSRRIVELEVENRGLRAEMDDMKGPQGGLSHRGAMVLGGGASSENVMELQRHLQFVEEEAELLRRSLIEMEEQNKLLMNEINRYKSELPTDTPTQEEELRLATLQIGELSGKVKKLQYENRVLLSNLQRCDLASYHSPTSSSSSSSLRLALETDAEAGDSAECLPRCSLLAVSYFFPFAFLTTYLPLRCPFILFIILLFDCLLSSVILPTCFPFNCDCHSFVCFPLPPLTPPHSSVPSSMQLSDLQVRLSEAEESVRGTQEDLKKERQGHKEIAVKLTQLQEEHQKAMLRRDFQLQSLGLQARLQKKLWCQERTLLVQESQHLKQALLLLSLKLRCFLKQWRLGCKKDTEWKDVLEINSLKDLYLLLEEENLPSPTHQTDKRAPADEQPLSPTIKSSAVSSTLADLKVALQDLSGELRQERQGSQELTQQFAKAKASWEVERTELKTTAMSSTDALDPPDLKVALKREREEHQHLLAESYAAVMDLTKQLQIGERNWGREKLELLERFSQERAQWEQRLREATAQQGKKVVLLFSCLLFQTPKIVDTCKTWDGPSGSCSQVGSRLDLEPVQRSYTAPDRTGIRIYYSPPTVRRTDHWRRNQEAEEPEHTQNGSFLLEVNGSDAGVAAVETQDIQDGSANNVVDGMSPSSPYHTLEIGEISANLSDDMKEMTNCVRQAIRSSSLERKSGKEPGSQAVAVSTRSTQTATQYVSIGLQTENLPSSRGTGLHSKVWSPRPSSGATSSLASARTRQISTSLDKVHSRIERPCCSPKYGSPKLQRRVSSDRSLWSLQQRPIGGGGGSAWARSTTTRDSPVLSGLTDGLSSLFSVVEHAGSTESLWRGDVGKHPSSQRYGGVVQEFFRNVCSSRSPGGAPLSGESAQRESLGNLGSLGVFSSVDEPKPECVSMAVGGLGTNNTSISNLSISQDAPCDCAAQSACFARPSRASTRHCKHRPQESLPTTEEKADTNNE